MNAKTIKIVYWITTAIIALLLLPSALFINSPEAAEGMKHLGLPLWFNYEISIGKTIGGIILILPFFPKRLKEWTYVAVGIDMISAVIALIAVDGFAPKFIVPIITFMILVISYYTYHKIQCADCKK